MRSSLALRSCYFLGGALVLSLAWLPLETLLSHFIFEDFFYYLNVAIHLNESGSATFDGSAATNGFHPIWMIFCMVAEKIGGKVNAIPWLLTLGAVFHLAQAWTFHRLLRALGLSRFTAHAGALFYLFNYRLIAWNLCGLEAPVQGFFLLFTLDFLLRERREWTRRQLVTLGFILALTVLARFDALLFVGLALGFLFSRRALLAAATFLLALTPWFAWSWNQSGALLPNSRVALNLWSFGNAVGTPIEILKTKLFSASWWLSDAFNLFGLWPWSAPTSAKIGGLLTLVVIFALAVSLWRSHARPRFSARAFLFVFGLAHLGYYVLFANAQLRYVMPWVLTILLLGFWTLEDALATQRARFVGVIAILFFVSAFAGADAWRSQQGVARTHANHTHLFRASTWLRDHTEPGSINGGWNCGIVGYFSEREVVNLDGVINDEAIEALRRHELSAYLQKRHVRYLVDTSDQVEWFMNRYSGEANWRGKWETVHREGPVEILRYVDAPAS